MVTHIDRTRHARWVLPFEAICSVKVSHDSASHEHAGDRASRGIFMRQITGEFTPEIVHYQYLKKIFSGWKYPHIAIYNFENRGTESEVKSCG